MKNRILLIGVTACAMLSGERAVADGGAFFDGGWRISGGAVYDMGVKTDMRFSPRQTYVSPFSQGLSKEEARKKAMGTREGTKVTYANGAWIDTDAPAAPASQGGDVPEGATWNLMLPRSAWNGDGTFSLGAADYSEVRTYAGDPASVASAQDDESGVWGFNVELSRCLYHDEEYRFGVELGLVFQYFRRNGLLEMSSSWCNGRSTCESGSYEARADLNDPELTGYLNDPAWDGFMWQGSPSHFGSASYGQGASASIAPTISATPRGTTQYDASYGSLDARGDYENLELMLLLRPYYDVCDGLRVNGTLGLVASRQEMEMLFTMRRDGATDYRSNKDFSQWDVYGVAGLGLAFSYGGFTLSGDFLARFLDRNLDVEDRYYRGTVERGTWMFRLSLGHSF